MIFFSQCAIFLSTMWGNHGIFRITCAIIIQFKYFFEISTKIFIIKMRVISENAINQEVLETLADISSLLSTGLDKETILILIKLLELGVQPETLSELVIEIRREIESYQIY
ncbi:Mitotic-spindle organizing protein 1 [Cryptosporidium tyzzeri]|nr:Mitotic-spindle organizing protein 1 [Cryptosporidium tyzzeri]